MKLDYFVSMMQPICQKYVPKHNASKKCNKIPRERKIVMKRRTKVENNFNLHSKNSERSRVRATLTEVEKSLQQFNERGMERGRRAYKEVWIIKKIKSNPKAFFR